MESPGMLFFPSVTDPPPSCSPRAFSLFLSLPRKSPPTRAVARSVRPSAGRNNEIRKYWVSGQDATQEMEGK